MIILFEGLEATRVVKINLTALFILWRNVLTNNVTTAPEFYTKMEFKCKGKVVRVYWAKCSFLGLGS